MAEDERAQPPYKLRFLKRSQDEIVTLWITVHWINSDLFIYNLNLKNILIISDRTQWSSKFLVRYSSIKHKILELIDIILLLRN